MIFTKMHGLGNDFIIIATEASLPEQASELAIRYCDRNFGIGADGLVFILPTANADFMMRIINSDGSESEQCGNAIRCVAKYVYDRKLTNKTELTVETLGAGAQNLQLTLNAAGKVESVRVDMGAPILDGLKVPTTITMNPVLRQPIEVDGHTFEFTAVSMGNPHCVIYVDDAVGMDLQQWGPKLENHPMFPRKINVEFATVKSRDYVDMRVWERGAGPTLACGTGACATLVSSVLNGLTDRTATISLKGGNLHIEWNEADDHLYMTGPASEVFTGSMI
jgi:diaminopimelate epimerase